MDRHETTYRDIDAAELAARLGTDDEPMVLDVREPDEVAEWAIAGSVNVPSGELGERIAELPSDREVVVVCAAGGRSALAADLLARAGLRVANLRGGMAAWGKVYDWVVIEVDAVRVVQVRRRGKGCLSYVVGAGDEAFVIDPSIDVEVYDEIAAEHGWRITRVFDTHLHADHLSGAARARGADRRGATAQSGRHVRVRVRASRRWRPLPPRRRGCAVGCSPPDAGTHAGVDDLLRRRPRRVDGRHLVRRRCRSPRSRRTRRGVRAQPVPVTARASAHAPRRRTDTARPLRRDRPRNARRSSGCDPRGAAHNASTTRFRSRTRSFAWAAERTTPRPPNYVEIIKANMGRSDLPASTLQQLEAGPNRCSA